MFYLFVLCKAGHSSLFRVTASFETGNFSVAKLLGTSAPSTVPRPTVLQSNT